MRRGGGVSRRNVLGDFPGTSPWKLFGTVGANYGGAGGGLIGIGNSFSLHVDSIAGRTAVTPVKNTAIFLDGAHSC